MTPAKPQLLKARLENLHPTQLTVGKVEVELKRKHWSQLGKKARAAALAEHWFPGVLGPDQRYYIVDHHHFGLALLEEEVSRVRLLLLKDLSWLTPAHFWPVLDHHQWVHPYDDKGQRRDFSAIPPRLTQLQDDPYRSLAGELRRQGGYAKDATPFSEFLWADYLRPRIALKRIVADFPQALARAMKLARLQDARYLPGWSGVING
ncbi:ParB-like protein [Pseudomonas akapageensis]|uniref:ParB-like protein n=1 Tax=Pseudomonas akapageensis TaxID=2609961 RepID=UPI00140DA844|nr:ParB-like protein [Pseudomonas akapageensis]